MVWAIFVIMKKQIKRKQKKHVRTSKKGKRFVAGKGSATAQKKLKVPTPGNPMAGLEFPPATNMVFTDGNDGFNTEYEKIKNGR